MEKSIKISCFFGWFFSSILIDFGWLSGAKLAPKSDPKSMSTSKAAFSKKRYKNQWKIIDFLVFGATWVSLRVCGTYPGFYCCYRSARAFFFHHHQDDYRDDIMYVHLFLFFLRIWCDLRHMLSSRQYITRAAMITATLKDATASGQHEK